MDHYKELLNNELTKLDNALSKSRSIRKLLEEADASVEDEIEMRGAVLQEILEIEEQMAKQLRIDEKDINFLNDKFSDELRQVGKTVSEIQQLDSEIRETLLKRKENIVKDMKKLQLGQILPDQYQRHERGGPSFVNIKE